MLAVLKRFGEGSGAPLSFPEPGWTLTIDLPARDDSVRTLLRELDEMVLGVGGRHYLAKDAHLNPDSVRRGYPRLGEWRDLRDQVDPQRHWTSDLARRLRLMDPDGSSTQEVSDA
jgi:decaprenylphospho-beta-D-ribofuranose 2-oxidase